MNPPPPITGAPPRAMRREEKDLMRWPYPKAGEEFLSLGLGVGDAHGLGNTGRTLLALDLDGPLVRHANAAVWHVVGGEQLLAAADARTDLHGAGVTHL